MGKLRKRHFLSRKLQKVKSFYRNSNPKYLNFLYIIVFCVPVFLMTFQNCKTTDVDTSSPQDSSTSAEDIAYEIGSIVRVDPVSGDFIADGLLPVNSDITFKFLSADPVSDNYKWTIRRGFDSIVTNIATETGTYKTQFSGLGAHDILAGSYKSTETEPKTTARKRVVVGESCSLTDILEIELSSESAASFKVGESGYATFVLKDSANFSSIEWKATLPSGDLTENEEDEDTLTVDLSSESVGTLVIEVSAVSSDTSKAGCLTYRRKELTVTSNVRPYFNPISFTDGRNDILLQLENNDIYKYARPETNRYLQMEVLNADSCQYQINNGNKVNFSCSGELIAISSSADTGCTEGVVTLLASNSQGEAHSQSYYHYCPEEGSYCYFGPTSARPSDHVCPVELASGSDVQFQKRSDFEVDPMSGRCGTVQNTCQIGQLNDIADTATHYKWQCVGSGGGTTVDCETEISTTTTSTTTITATTPSCTSGQHTSSSACNSANPSNSTCSAQGNGCYGWLCNSGYTKSNNSCVQQVRSCPFGQYTSQTACDNANPSNSTCSAQGNGCYGWSCNSGYRKSGNKCVVCTTSSSCNSSKPANSTCSVDGNGCYGWSCNSGYRKSGNKCVVCTTSSSCNSSKPANSTCSVDGNGCYGWSCNSGYRKSGNSCVLIQSPPVIPPIIVPPTSTPSCPSGQYSSSSACNRGNPSNSTCSSRGNRCYGWSCNSGYTKSGNSCVVAQGPSCGTSRNTCNPGTRNDGAVADTTSSYKWRCSHNGQNINSCFSCKSGYRKSGNSCVRNPSPPVIPPTIINPNPCSGVTCTNGRVCSNGSCVCPSGQCCPSCTGGQQCSGGRCITPNPCSGVTCTSGRVCSNGSCVCPSGQCCPSCTGGQQCSGGRCITPNPCSGVTCTSGRVCSNGSCVCPSGQCCPSCTGGKQCSGGRCITPNPCSGVTCTSGRVCSNGSCVCPSGQCCPSCTGGKQCSGGRCITPNPCSGVTCTSGRVCSNGSCVCPSGQCCPSCTGGQQCSGGRCITPNPCSGVTCTSGRVCSNGSCVCPSGQCCPSCTGGQQCSGGRCITPNPCSGVTCTSGRVCSNGSCVCPSGQCCPSCTGGQQCSGGRCITPNPCAGVTCSNGRVCSNGSCVCPSGQCCPSCTGGKQCSGGRCVTTVTCGRCGSSNEICAAGDPHNHPPDTNTQWLWTCRNSPHEPGQCGSREVSCSKNKPSCESNADCPDCEACKSGQCKSCNNAVECQILGLPLRCR